MALQNIADKTIIAAAKKERNVIDEDSFTEKIEKIIERDFFPDIPKMKIQEEFLNAVDRQDVEKLREIHIKYGPKRKQPGLMQGGSIYDTPATFETPLIQTQSTEIEDNIENAKRNARHGEEETSGSQNSEGFKKPLSLDSFLSKYTSEDNASFEVILKENEKKNRLKNEWLYNEEQQREKDENVMLALPSIEQQAMITSNSEMQSWKYKAYNAVMYVPDALPLSAEEKIELAKSKPREIIYENTRIKSNPFVPQKNKETSQTGIVKAPKSTGKIGPDGKEIMPQQMPAVQGYGFVATPSPAPGVEESPFMTWGEIEGTPFRLDGGDTPLVTHTPGPGFRIPEVPERNRLAWELAEKASKSHRKKKEEAIKSVTARLSSPSMFLPSRTSRIASLSPAAQKLATGKLRIGTATDKALRASYTPSPSSHHGENSSKDKTPVLRTPQNERTPNSLHWTPKAVYTPTRTEAESLTDNLLNLPPAQKRTKASEFF